MSKVPLIFNFKKYDASNPNASIHIQGHYPCFLLTEMSGGILHDAMRDSYVLTQQKAFHVTFCLLIFYLSFSFIMGWLVTDLSFSSPTALIYLYSIFLCFMHDGQLLLEILSCLITILFLLLQEIAKNIF